MMDPLPLTQDGATPFETLLLSAGRTDALSSQSRARIHLGLGLGSGMLAASAIATGLKANAVRSVLSFGSAAWISGVGALALFFGAHAFIDVRSTKMETRPQPVVAQPARAAAPALPVRVATPQGESPSVDAIESRRAEAKPSVRSLPGASLAAELRAIEDARRALTRREHAHALRVLDEYAKTFPKQSLGTEATLLRIETLAASGATEAAHQLGTSFLAKHPNGPYARRVRSLLADAAPTVGER